MRNQTKDKLLILVFMLAVLFMFVFLVFSIISLITKKAEATEINYNKFMTEERIKAEMYHNSVCELIDSMTDEEYYKTFLKGE
jgi:ABC-type sulfate transport system permease component